MGVNIDVHDIYGKYLGSTGHWDCLPRAGEYVSLALDHSKPTALTHLKVETVRHRQDYYATRPTVELWCRYSRDDGPRNDLGSP